MSQLRRLMRRLHGGAAGVGAQRAMLGAGGLSALMREPDYRDELANQQDYARTHLAEELLKIALEDAPWDSDDIAAGKTSADFVGLAEAALAAAEVIYPEPPEATKPQVPVYAATESFQSVMGHEG